MEVTQKIRAIFPTRDAIPAEYLFETPIEQNNYLVNGELRQWNGPMQDVLSPVYVHTPSGPAPQFLGRYPLLTETEAMAALHSAMRAYNQGRGLWPTMSVADRIKHIEDFGFRMREKKREVVALLMLEMGSRIKMQRKNLTARLPIS